MEKKLEEFETIINDLRTEINALDRTEPVSTASSIDSKQGARPSITMSSTGFVVPQVVRQFIISAVTCDPNKREESALLLANIIGCTLEVGISLYQFICSLGEEPNFPVISAKSWMGILLPRYPTRSSECQRVVHSVPRLHGTRDCHQHPHQCPDGESGACENRTRDNTGSSNGHKR